MSAAVAQPAKPAAAAAKPAAAKPATLGKPAVAASNASVRASPTKKPPLQLTSTTGSGTASTKATAAAATPAARPSFATAGDDENWVCAHCQTLNAADAAVCKAKACKKPRYEKCKNCEALLTEPDKACTTCGAGTEKTAPAPAPKAAPVKQPQPKPVASAPATKPVLKRPAPVASTPPSAPVHIPSVNDPKAPDVEMSQASAASMDSAATSLYEPYVPADASSNKRLKSSIPMDIKHTGDGTASAETVAAEDAAATAASSTALIKREAPRSDMDPNRSFTEPPVDPRWFGQFRTCRFNNTGNIQWKMLTFDGRTTHVLMMCAELENRKAVIQAPYGVFGPCTDMAPFGNLETTTKRRNPQTGILARADVHGAYVSLYGTDEKGVPTLKRAKQTCQLTTKIYIPEMRDETGQFDYYQIEHMKFWKELWRQSWWYAVDHVTKAKTLFAKAQSNVAIKKAVAGDLTAFHREHGRAATEGEKREIWLNYFIETYAPDHQYTIKDKKTNEIKQGDSFYLGGYTFSSAANTNMDEKFYDMKIDTPEKAAKASKKYLVTEKNDPAAAKTVAWFEMHFQLRIVCIPAFTWVNGERVTLLWSQQHNIGPGVIAAPAYSISFSENNPNDLVGLTVNLEDFTIWKVLDKAKSSAPASRPPPGAEAFAPPAIEMGSTLKMLEGAQPPGSGSGAASAPQKQPLALMPPPAPKPPQRANGTGNGRGPQIEDVSAAAAPSIPEFEPDPLADMG
jgi:hypothetical protein